MVPHVNHQPFILVLPAWLGASLVFLPPLLGSTAQAQTRTWDGGGADTNWSTPGNWSSDNVPADSGEAALFTDHPVGQTKLAANLSADVTIGQLQFSATAPGYTITGTGMSTLFLSPNASYGGVAVVVAGGAADQSITAYEVEFLSSQTWDIGGTTTLTVTGRIEDAPSPDYALMKNGTGTLVFSGDVRHDGPTTVNAGALVLSYNNISMLSALNVNAGLLRGTSDTSALGSSSTRNHITLAGGALELANDTGLTFGHASRRTILSGNSTIRPDRLTAGPGVTHTLGLLTVGTQTLTMTPGSNITGGTAGITFGGTTLSGNATFDVADSIAAGAQLTLGVIGQSGGTRSLMKTGSGTLRLNGSASYTGSTTLSGGAMSLGAANALGSGGFNFAGGTLHANNITDSSIGALTLSADSTLNLSPGGAAATLTFAGVSGTPGGILTITGWSGSPGSPGTNDKIIFSGGTMPGVAFLQHIHFALDNELYVGAIGVGGELHASTVVADSDDDGMPDTWESDHGLDPDDPADADLDLDRDGVTNRHEYVFGTDPEDSMSSSIIQSIHFSDEDGFTMVFASLLERTYTIWRSPDFVTWTPISTDQPGTGGLIEFKDHPGEGTGFFYRVEANVAPP